MSGYGGHGAFWSREDCFAALHRWVAEHGRVPSENTDWLRAEYGRPCGRSVRRIFGSWSGFIIAAGYEPRGPGCAPGLRVPGETVVWSKERIAEAMLDWYFEFGAWPTVPEWRQPANGRNRPSICTVKRAFGTWSAAKRYAGWPAKCHQCAKPLPKKARAYSRWCSNACRHENQRGVPPVKPYIPQTTCSGCGIDLDDYVPGCVTCDHRRHNRSARAKRAAEKNAPGRPLGLTLPGGNDGAVRPGASPTEAARLAA